MKLEPIAAEPLLQVEFHQGTTFYPNVGLKDLIAERLKGRQVVVVTDQNLAKLHPEVFRVCKHLLVIEAGEAAKTFSQLELAIDQLIALEAHRKTVLVGVGGGVVTDFTGLLASLFMRGIEFGFVPTTILGAVDASIGGKNGINYGKFKNYVGTINQPAFVGIDPSFFETLPEEEFINGFAEVIKYACIYDFAFFEFLERHSLHEFRTYRQLLQLVLQKCVQLKAAVVQADAFEKNQRKQLNFGHTIGHAIELTSGLPHGFAIAIGMHYAAKLSVRMGFLSQLDSDRICRLIVDYRLPTNTDTALEVLWSMLLRDKKKSAEGIDFILLERIGSARVQQMPVAELFTALKDMGV